MGSDEIEARRGEAEGAGIVEGARSTSAILLRFFFSDSRALPPDFSRHDTALAQRRRLHGKTTRCSRSRFVESREFPRAGGHHAGNATAAARAGDRGRYTPIMAIRPALRDELLKLPADERQTLADELYESLDDQPLDPAWESAWSDEIARRVQEIADGKVQLVDADDMHAELRKELRSLDE